LTLHEIVVMTTFASCVCDAGDGCLCTASPPGVHYARLARARRRGFIGREDFAQAIHDADVFTGMSVLIDPGEVAA
jgi:hypothetical protein